MSSWGTLIPGGDQRGRGPRRALRAGEREHEFVVKPEWAAAIPEAVALIPGVCGVLTSAFEHKRGGVMVHRVMKCSDAPACIAVAVPKGQRLATLIRDSHAFAINMLERSTRLMLKKFAADEEGDPFDTFELTTMATGSPVLKRCVGVLDCEVMRHFDLESDHELYVGQVIAATLLQQAPAVTVPGREVPLVQPDDERPGEDEAARGRVRRGAMRRGDDLRERNGAISLDRAIPASPK